jgi:hypothetical protein
MHLRKEQYNQYPHIQELVMFDPIPQEKWLTARQIAKALPDTSYSRIVEVLQDLRKVYAIDDNPPYVLIGKAYLYHPDFVQLVDNREKKPGVKSQNLNKK